jgi:hypothetical protein
MLPPIHRPSKVVVARVRDMVDAERGMLRPTTIEIVCDDYRKNLRITPCMNPIAESSS